MCMGTAFRTPAIGNGGILEIVAEFGLTGSGQECNLDASE